VLLFNSAGFLPRRIVTFNLKGPSFPRGLENTVKHCVRGVLHCGTSLANNVLGTPYFYQVEQNKGHQHEVEDLRGKPRIQSPTTGQAQFVF